MKIAIVGTRNPGVSYQEWESILISKINASEISLIISGGAKGIDTYAKLFVGRHHIPLMEYLPEYSKYGRKATLRRNTQIVREAIYCDRFPLARLKRSLPFHSRSETSLQTSHRRQYFFPNIIYNMKLGTTHTSV